MAINFSDRAIKTFGLATCEAWRLGRRQPGNAHVLLGLLAEGGGLAPVILQNEGVTLDAASREVEKLLARYEQAGSSGIAISTVIDAAIQIAEELGDSQVGTEHLLLGLIRNKEGPAAEILIQLGANLEALRKDLLVASGHEAQ